MSNLVCPVCGGANIQTERRWCGCHHCKGCEYSWQNLASQQKQTIFGRVTASPEVLAPYFVFLKAFFVTNINPKQQWISTLTGEVFSTREEAIAATVAKLKEVAE